MKDGNELFELCEQVYEATGWDESENVWYANGGDVSRESPLLSRRMVFDKPLSVPLYTSDYLLEKLPHTLSDSDGDKYTITVHKVGDNWLANYIFDNVGMYHSYADTPLKALLKLTIKLHEEKTL